MTIRRLSSLRFRLAATLSRRRPAGNGHRFRWDRTELQGRLRDDKGYWRWRGAAKDRALDYVKAQVLTGAFSWGELISEGEVASARGMSRTPVREAFLRLEAEGLLRLYPKRGALVPVSPEEVRVVTEARLLLEQFAAGKVIRRGPAARKAAYERLSAN